MNLDSYLNWINTNENDKSRDLVEINIFKRGLQNNQMDIVKLAIMRGILHLINIENMEWLLLEDSGIYDMISEHVIQKVQNRENPIYLNSHICRILKQYTGNIDKIYCKRIIWGGYTIDNLTTLKCTEMDLSEINMFIVNCNIKNLSACMNNSCKLDYMGIKLPKLEKLTLFLNDIVSYIRELPIINTPNLRKLRLKYKGRFDYLHLRDLHQPNIKYLHLTGIKVLFSLTNCLDKLVLNMCIITSDVTAKNIIMNNCNTTALVRRGFGYEGYARNEYNHYIICENLTLSTSDFYSKNFNGINCRQLTFVYTDKYHHYLDALLQRINKIKNIKTLKVILLNDPNHKLFVNHCVP